MTLPPARLRRRDLLVGSAVLATNAAIGCRQPTQPVVETPSRRSDVPLRVALVGTEGDAEAIRRGWAAVTEQPLGLQAIALDRTEVASLAGTVAEATQKSDLVIYPLSLIAHLVAAGALVALAEEDFSAIDNDSKHLLSALRSGAAQYAGEFYSVPLGASLPALLTADAADPVPSWTDYDDLVRNRWAGAAAEPSAPGWAAAMFLWRSSSHKEWLFGRERFEPLINTEPYQESLQQMIDTNSQYKLKRQTPQQVWNGLKSGELQGGIGFPLEPDQEDAPLQVQVQSLPATSSTSRVLLDAFSPVISLSANCRQSAAAKQFLKWIGGGEGSDAVRKQVPGMTVIRDAAAFDSASTAYEQWLATRLGTPVTKPTLQLLHSDRYYAVLDEQVGRTLDGEATPQAALAEVAQQWSAITEEIGLTKQRRAWRRAQGLGT